MLSDAQIAASLNGKTYGVKGDIEMARERRGCICRLVDGREFKSIQDAAKAVGMVYSTLLRRLENGQIPFSKEPPRHPGGNNKQETTINGVVYESRSAAARALGIPVRTLFARVRRRRLGCRVNVPLGAPPRTNWVNRKDHKEGVKNA